MSMSMSTLSQRGKFWNCFLFTSGLEKFQNLSAGTNAKLENQLQRYSMKVRSSSGKIFANILSQQYFRRPMRLCPSGCEAKTLLIQRCPGSVAKYRAKFQWCRRQISDHDLDPICEVKARTRSFQMWRISCYGNDQFIQRGGLTTDRRSGRYATSILCQWWRQLVRCPAAKHATWDMTRSWHMSGLRSMRLPFRP